MLFPFEIPVEAVKAVESALEHGTGSQAERIAEGLQIALPYLQFSPTGDNHHNANLCPYCQESHERRRDHA
jgi:hypothetical protein